VVANPLLLAGVGNCKNRFAMAAVGGLEEGSDKNDPHLGLLLWASHGNLCPFEAWSALGFCKQLCGAHALAEKLPETRPFDIDIDAIRN
jgi:hypothetical protein